MATHFDAGLEASHVVVAGTGAVYVAPEGTTLPTGAPDVAPNSAFVNLGYIGEDGVTFTFDRETEDIMAWQSMEPVRVVTTSEPKTLAFELLEFDDVTFVTAMGGGTLASLTGLTTFTPPAPGENAIQAMVVDALDGPNSFRWIFPRVQLSGSVEHSLVRSDAVRMPLEFSVLASTPPWSMVTDAPEWVVP